MGSETFRCAIEESRRAGWKRCSEQCEHCRGSESSAGQMNLTRDDGRPMTTCETASGLYFDYDDPRPEQITLRDVASHLSVVCRFGGATVEPLTGEPFFYSVAQHALFVRDLVGEWGHPELCLAALHHDDHEFMLGDWPTPLKRKLRAAGVTVLDEMVAATNRAVGDRFGIDPELFEHPLVKKADVTALFREAATFKASGGVGVHWGRSAPAAPLELTEAPPRDVMLEFMDAHRRDGGLE